MSSGMNSWTGAGNLTEDPTLRYTQSGTAVLNLRMACNERYKDRDGQWQDRAEFVTCVVWDKRAEALAKFLVKGSFVMVQGKLRTSSYEDKNGQKRWRTEVVARDVILPPKGGGQSGGNGQRGGDGCAPSFDAPADAFGDDDDPDSIPF